MNRIATAAGVTVATLLMLLASATPAHAQIDFSGVWQPIYQEDVPERLAGPALRDYVGLPINDSARQFADSWDPARITLPEEQCRVHVSPYIYRGPTQLRIWEEKDPQTQQLVAIKHFISTYEQTRTIYMDGRPHPGPNAPHTWMGFSTGHYEGDMLVIETTHLKQGWVRRNGLPMSDQATMTEYWVRNGDLLQDTFVLVDPVYLTEPLVKSQDFSRSPRELPAGVWIWICEPVVEVDRPEGEVPAYMPNEHPFKNEFGQQNYLPEIAVRGGAETMYPEFQSQIIEGRKTMTPPKPPPPPQPPPGAAPTTPAPAPPAGRGNGGAPR
jgi:hypothetical protein